MKNDDARDACNNCTIRGDCITGQMLAKASPQGKKFFVKADKRDWVLFLIRNLHCCKFRTFLNDNYVEKIKQADDGETLLKITAEIFEISGVADVI